MVEWTDPDRIETAMLDREDEWLSVLRTLVETPSLNPPGDTRDVAEYVVELLDDHGIDNEVIAPNEEMPNVVAQFEGATRDGPHLTFNGHLDTYPVGEEDRWERDPLSCTVEDGRIYGRGTSDMHGGFTATLAAFLYLFEHRDEFDGTVSFAAVSDEETGGEWGTKYLVDNHPEYTGDAVLNAEPSAGFIRFAERGPLWIDLRVRGESAHSAYPAGLNAIEVLVDVLYALRNDPDFAGLANVPDDVRAAIDSGRDETDARFGEGATDFVMSPSLNVGTIGGGEKINLTAEVARAEVDIRLPVGTATDDALAWVQNVVEAYPGDVTAEVISRTEPTVTDPDDPIVSSVERWAGRVQGRSEGAPLGCGFGFTDCRFYRRAGVPSVVYGPTPYGMGSQNEYITVDEFRETVTVHALAGVDFMTGGAVSDRA